MGYLGSYVGGYLGSYLGAVDDDIAVTPPAATSNLTTASAIRDRVITLLEALTPNSLSHDKFRKYRNEGKADFESWVATSPQGGFRRFQVRDTGQDYVTEVSNTDQDERRLTLEIRIAYPQTARTGRDQALDRDDVADEDFHQIDYKIGIYGRANFTVALECDACPMGLEKTRAPGDGVDVMTMTCRFTYQRSSQ